MEQTTSEHIVFRALKRVNGSEVWRYVKSARYTSEMSWTENPREAQHFDPSDVSEIIKTYDAMQKHKGSGERVEFVRVTVQTSIEKIGLDEGEYLDERRKNALAKLTPDDIQVLDLGKLASYDKLKHHPL